MHEMAETTEAITNDVLRMGRPCSCAFRGRRRLGLPAPGYTLRARHSVRYWPLGHNDMPCWPASRTITCTSAVDAGRTTPEGRGHKQHERSPSAALRAWPFHRDAPFTVSARCKGLKVAFQSGISTFEVSASKSAPREFKSFAPW
jgi:hypothetical protein